MKCVYFKLAFLVAITWHTRYSTCSRPQYRVISEMGSDRGRSNTTGDFLPTGLRVFQTKLHPKWKEKIIRESVDSLCRYGANAQYM